MLAHRAFVGLFALALCAFATAQDFRESLATAQQLINEREWARAFEHLTALADKATAAEELEQVAAAFAAAGDGAGEANRDLALQAHERELAIRQAIHGDRDHALVAGSLNIVGFSLWQLGRRQDALPRLEAALAMRERLYTGRDHPDLAQSFTNVGYCLSAMGRLQDALPRCEAALTMFQRLNEGNDHPDVANCQLSVANCLPGLGRLEEAVRAHEAVLAMRQRLCGEGDHRDVAVGLASVGVCLRALGRTQDALLRQEAALDMVQRLYGGQDHPDVVSCLGYVVVCLLDLERAAEAMPQCEAALAMSRRLAGPPDSAEVAASTSNLATCLRQLGRAQAALPEFEAALAMRQRLIGEGAHPEVAGALNNLALCLEDLGRMADALPKHEAALAMCQRLFGGRDDAHAATNLNNVAACLIGLGRAQDALPKYEAALAMQRRLHREADHREIAMSLNNLASCLEVLGRTSAALPLFEESLAMKRRLLGDRDHPDLATTLGNLAHCLTALGRAQEALPMMESGHDMLRRLHGDHDHPELAASISNLAACMTILGRPTDALPLHEAALAMRRRLYGGTNHPDVANTLGNLAACLLALGQTTAARERAGEAAAMIEGVRGAGRLSAELRQSMFDELKRFDTLEQLQQIDVRLSDPAAALHTAELSRSRELLDILEQQRADPLAEAQRRARERGDGAVGDRIDGLRREIDAATAESSRLQHLSTRLFDATDLPAAEHAARITDLRTRSEEAGGRLRQLLDERARIVADVVPAGRVRSPDELQAALLPGELLLEFTVGSKGSLLYVVPPQGEVTALELPGAAAAIDRHLPVLLQSIARDQLGAPRGRDPDSAPAPDPGGASSDSRALFAALVPREVWTRVKACRRVWIAAHRGLHRLPFEALVVDNLNGRERYWLDDGPPIAYVPSGSVLCWLRQRGRGSGRATLDLLAVGDPRRSARAGEHERLARLPALRGARAEVAAVAAAFIAADQRKDRVRVLLGEEATVTAVFELAPKSRFLHFACHGIAEEFAGQSLSMLVLARPDEPLAADDGVLQLSELYRRWGGRLEECQLVVLAACRTNVGRLYRDEAPQALPLGFLYAGAAAVIPSLWAVDDASTGEMMTDFYRRVLGGETDHLAALAAAKRALRGKHPEPYYWAPFVYVGCPE